MGWLSEIGSSTIDNTFGTHIFGNQNSTDRALAAQRQSMDSASSTLRDIYGQQRTDQEPYRQAGIKALNQMQSGDIMGDIQNDSGYQFRLNEGLKAVNGSAAARGMTNSGATMKALTRYGQDYASNEYQNAYNRLSNLAGFGASANSNLLNASSNYGNQISSNQIGYGNAVAAANMNQASNMSGLMGQGISALALASDKRVKKNIESLSKEDIKEFKKSLKGYTFNYKTDEFGTGDWAGVMAQDLEKSKLGQNLVIESDDGVKKVDLAKAVSLILAIIAED